MRYLVSYVYANTKRNKKWGRKEHEKKMNSEENEPIKLISLPVLWNSHYLYNQTWRLLIGFLSCVVSAYCFILYTRGSNGWGLLNRTNGQEQNSLWYEISCGLRSGGRGLFKILLLDKVQPYQDTMFNFFFVLLIKNLCSAIITYGHMEISFS